MKKILFITLIVLSACSQPAIQVVTTTQSEPWVLTSKVLGASEKNNSNVIIESSQTLQEIEGFGTCFNELGWTSLRRLQPNQREDILKELFEPGIGANFTICRMPVAANDFARKWYSYNETDGDFEMKHFSISNDQETLIPYIKNALKFNPHLKLWASPWSPPKWMKYNKHYAAKSVLGDSDFQSDEWGMDLRGINNGLIPEKEGLEGTDMFIQQPKYFEAYALYFSKFIEAYKNEGIDIFMVMPQNEFNSPQVFPSCTWTASGLSKFIGKYLGPQMQKLNVKVMMSTVERPAENLIDTVLTNNEARKYLSGVGFQWAGKGAIPGIHKRYPELQLYQTEQECGNGKNDWTNCIYSWDLMKHYLTNGANAYMYWNTSLDEGGISTWGWKQNSLVSIDTIQNTYHYNHEYYLLKHVSHFVQPGAKLIKTSGNFNDLLAFINPDASIIVVLRNNLKTDQEINIMIDNKPLSITLKADSFTTLNI
nr:glycoside hydrolase family 30 beta sandwich domain-containing protein [uncultured Carboxylicivirga sp.]